MQSPTRAAGDTFLATDHNQLRDDAYLASMLRARQQDTPGLTLYVEPGHVYINGARVAYAGGSSPTFTAPAANPRIDILSMNSSGTLVRTAGTEAASPVAPTYPDGNFYICEVYNRVGQTIVYTTDQASNGYISKDLRPIFEVPKFPVVNLFDTPGTLRGDSTTQFDITLVSGTTYRYTWDTTGTNPSISSGTMPIGSVVSIHSPNFNAANNGVFVVTGVASGYFEVTNASGVAENNKTLSTGSLVTGSSSYVWTKSPFLKYIRLRIQGPGNKGGVGTSGGSSTTTGSGGWWRWIH